MKIIQMIIEKYYNRMLRIFKVFKYEPPLNKFFYMSIYKAPY